MLVLPTYLNWASKLTSRHPTLNFGYKSPYPTLQMIVHGKVDSAWLASNDGPVEISYSPRHGNSKIAALDHET